MGSCLLVIACYSNQMNSAITHAYLGNCHCAYDRSIGSV